MWRLFDFKCCNNHCGHEFEQMVNGDYCPACPECYMKTKKLPCAPNINIGVPHHGYFDENLGTHVNSNKHRRELMRKQGVTPKGETPKPNGQAWV